MGPTTLKFFIFLGNVDFENIWNLDSYINFMVTLSLISGFSFQVPIMQIGISKAGILSPVEMLNITKYVIVLTSLLAGILTPSTDPHSQILLIGSFISLYLFGIGLLEFKN